MERFNFFIPAKLVKGSDRKGKDTYKVEGVITDTSTDSDGDSLLPENLDFSEFSIINWDHNKGPDAIIGAPSSIDVRRDSVYMEGDLWTDVDNGEKAVNLMKAMGKRGKKLGWSIEGEVTERDFRTKRPVKAKVTAVALCPFPKNGNTFAQLAKSKSSVYQPKHILKWDDVSNGGDSTDGKEDENGRYLVKFLDDSGNEIRVNKDYSVNVKKAQTVGNSGVLIKEDVEGNPKRLSPTRAIPPKFTRKLL